MKTSAISTSQCWATQCHMCFLGSQSHCGQWCSLQVSRHRIAALAEVLQCGGNVWKSCVYKSELEGKPIALPPVKMQPNLGKRGVPVPPPPPGRHMRSMSLWMLKCDMALSGIYIHRHSQIMKAPQTRVVCGTGPSMRPTEAVASCCSHLSAYHYSFSFSAPWTEEEVWSDGLKHPLSLCSIIPFSALRAGGEDG